MSKSRDRKKATTQDQTTATKIKLHPRAVDALERQLERFREKFGREPGPNEDRPPEPGWRHVKVAQGPPRGVGGGSG